MSRTEPDSIAVLVLAAGRATRFGSAKQLAPFRGHPLVRVVVEQVLAAGLDDIVVVTGHQSRDVAAALDDLPIRTVYNERYNHGMGTSIAAGVRAQPLGGVRAVIIVLADQPLPAEGVIAELMRAYRAGRGDIVVPVYAGTRGNPVLFDACFFDELAELEGDVGARGVIEEHESRVAAVDFPFPPPPDVDTPGDLERLS